jgi:hypothetical protein
VSSKTSWWYYSCQEKHFNIKFAIFSWHLAKSNNFFFVVFYFLTILSFLSLNIKVQKIKTKTKTMEEKFVKKALNRQRKKKSFFFCLIINFSPNIFNFLQAIKPVS